MPSRYKNYTNAAQCDVHAFSVFKKQIVYYAVEHNYYLFRRSYFFRSFTTVMSSRTQYFKKGLNAIYIFHHVFSLYGIPQFYGVY